MTQSRYERGQRLGRAWALATVLLGILSLGWVASQIAEPWGGPLPGWVLASLTVATVAGACRHAALGAADAVPRGFWSRLAWAICLMSAGLLVTGLHRATDLSALTAVAWFCYAGGTVALGAALIMLPASARTPHERAMVLLDVVTVTVAGCLIAWYAAMSTGVFDASRMNGWSLTGLVAVSAIGLFTVVRVRLAWEAPVDHPALVLLGLGILLATALSVVGVEGDSHTNIDRAHLSAPLAGVLWSIAALRQRRAYRRRPAGRHAARRPFSLLPYVAAGAVAVLVLRVVPTDPRERVVLHGSMVLVVLVLSRQILAAYDNARLLRQVDAGMIELRHHERRFRSMVQQAADIIVLTDPDGAISYASPALRQLVGMPDDAEQGHSIFRYVHPEDRRVVARHGASVATAPAGVVTFRARLRHRDGDWRWLEIISTNMLADPSVRGIVSNGRDITEMLRYQEQLAHQATHDELTGLGNRRLLLSRSEAVLAAAGGRRACVALLDIDDFKAIHDRLGHDVGDALLTAVGSVLAANVRAVDTVARLSGDEFGILLADASPDDAAATAERIMAALETPVAAAGYQLLVQASVGVSHGAAGDHATELLRRADVALHAAKERGKSRYAVYDTALDRRSSQHAQIGAELRNAMDAGDQLYLLYQPIVELPAGRITGVEALVRWQHPQRGVVSPADFIPIAERTGLIVPMGRWILRQACGQAARWGADEHTAGLTVSVNVSARQLREPGFPEDVVAALAESGLDPARLTVEVTETAVFDSDAALETLRGLHRLGVRLALDDFGTGHSSLGLLRTCPVDILKVDKSFVDGVLGAAEHAAIAISLVQITSTMGLTAVAEGVETAAQARALHRLGYRFAQGYHFARPLPPDEVAAMVAGPVDRAAAA